MTSTFVADSSSECETQYLEVDDWETGQRRRLAYMKEAGTRSPGVVFIPGFMSKKDNIKPKAIHQFCKEQGYPYVRYDPTGLGESEGPVQLKDARFSHWLQDAEEVLKRLTEGPQLLIGSSMGGWISICVAEKAPEVVHSLLLLAPSINFPSHYMKQIRSKAPPPLLELLEKGGSYEYNDPKYGPYPLSLCVFEEMIPYQLPLEEEGACPITCPVHILHGTDDVYSPYMNSLKLLTGLKSSNMQLLYLKGVSHHLDDPASLHTIGNMILKLANPSRL